MLTMGWVSDKLGGRRARLSALAMVPLLLAFLGLILSGSLLLTSGDFTAPGQIIERLQSRDPLGSYLWNRIPDKFRNKLKSASGQEEQAQALSESFNALLKDESLSNSALFAGVSMRDRTKQLLSQQLHGARAIYRNRLLLEDSFPEMMERSRFTARGLLWFNLMLFGVIGFFVYVPVMFSGVVALDLTSKKAQATAAGFVGFFGYVGGRMIQGIGIGWLSDKYGWDAALWALMGCILLGIILLAFLWNVR